MSPCHRFIGGRSRALQAPPRWFSKLGPLTWYQREWISLNLHIGHCLLARVHRGRFGWHISLGGTIRRWSMHGIPAAFDSWWTISNGLPDIE